MKSLFDFKMACHPELTQSAAFSRTEMINFLERCLDMVYPGNIRKSFYSEEELGLFQDDTALLLKKILKSLGVDVADGKIVINSFINSLSSIAKLVCTDAEALLAGDPSAASFNEVILTYPGLQAIATHRIAHFFYCAKVAILPRALSEIMHGRTGIDIHPGAQIGASFFIDHGTGLVIGETAVIGKNVKVYQGVTLGALSVDKNLAQKKRHPTIEDDCVIYSHATILGGETVIGEKSIIGGNVWITKSIPAGSTVYHKSEVRFNKLNTNEEITYEI